MGYDTSHIGISRNTSVNLLFVKGNIFPAISKPDSQSTAVQDKKQSIFSLWHNYQHMLVRYVFKHGSCFELV